MALYVVVDVGCIECGEQTQVVGVFTEKLQAEAMATGAYFVGGQRSLECFVVTELNVDTRIDQS